jgi:hypothetical protein
VLQRVVLLQNLEDSLFLQIASRNIQAVSGRPTGKVVAKIRHG